MMEAGNDSAGDYTSLTSDGPGTASQQPMPNSGQHSGELDLDSGMRGFKESGFQTDEKFRAISLMTKRIIGEWEKSSRVTGYAASNF